MERDPHGCRDVTGLPAGGNTQLRALVEALFAQFPGGLPSVAAVEGLPNLSLRYHELEPVFIPCSNRLRSFDL